MRTCIIIFLVCLKGLCQNIDYSEFSGKPVKIDQTAQLDTPYFLDYNSYQYSEMNSPVIYEVAEKVVSDKYSELLSENTSDTIVNSIKLYSKLSFIYQGNLVSIIKYRTVKGSLLSEIKTMQTQKSKNRWVEIRNENLEKIEYVFGVLTTRAFWQFYKTDNDLNYPEINKIKSLVKDAHGILNIDKLVTVVIQNKNNLESFLEK